eukprot:comp24770_c0_seq1/m.46878 comp24770_c0_seq1/g.46878  ORF comp24770_c0_seq1/g.46878 comp24770_c0_seq1/m.46878 type:complete len:238 (-) comp24770_c0_seq1:522-1235(-)
MNFKQFAVFAVLAVSHTDGMPVRITRGSEKGLSVAEVGSGDSVYNTVSLAQPQNTITTPTVQRMPTQGKGREVVVTVTTERSVNIPPALYSLLQTVFPQVWLDRLPKTTRTNEIHLHVPAAKPGSTQNPVMEVMEVTLRQHSPIFYAISGFVFIASLLFFCVVWFGCAFRCGPAENGDLEIELRMDTGDESVKTVVAECDDSDDEEGVVVVEYIPTGDSKIVAAKMSKAAEAMRPAA